MRFTAFSSRILKTGRELLAAALELLKVTALSLAIILPIRYFLVQPFYVKGASMEPNFYDHEYLIIDELSYRLREPERGEIIVFRYPHDPAQFFIKRLVGLPGETVEIRNGLVRVANAEHPQGLVLSEKYLDQKVKRITAEKVQLQPGQYYVLGDNRVSSLDSRVFGPITRSAIVGRVWLRGWPLDRLAKFVTPTYHLQR